MNYLLRCWSPIFTKQAHVTSLDQTPKCYTAEVSWTNHTFCLVFLTADMKVHNMLLFYKVRKPAVILHCT